MTLFPYSSHAVFRHFHLTIETLSLGFRSNPCIELLVAVYNCFKQYCLNIVESGLLSHFQSNQCIKLGKSVAMFNW